MNFENNFLNKVKEKTKTTLKAGLTSLVLLHGSNTYSQQKNVPVDMREKIQRTIEVNDLLKEASPLDLYDNFSIENILKDMPVEDFKKIKNINDVDSINVYSPYLNKVRDIEEKNGVKGNIPVLPGDFESKDDFIKEFVRQKLEYQKKVGPQLEEFKNKYYQGKYAKYLEELNSILNSKEKFKGGYIIKNDLIINSFLNKYYFPEEGDDYKDEILNFIESYQEDLNWRRFDYNQTEEDIEIQARDLWDLDQKIKQDKNNPENDNPKIINNNNVV